MSITVVQHASTTVAVTSGTTVTVSPAFASNTAAGNCLVAVFSINNIDGPSGGPVVTGITSVTTNGSAENWAQGAAAPNYSGAPTELWVYVNPDTGGGQKIIDLNIDIGAAYEPYPEYSMAVLADIYEVAGLAASSVTDKTSTGASNASETWSSGATATTSQASEIAFGGAAGFVATADTTQTFAGPGSGFTNETALEETVQNGGTTAADSYYCYQVSGYQILSSEGAVTYAGTASSAGSYNTAAVVTLKAAGGGTTTTAEQVITPDQVALAGTVDALAPQTITLTQVAQTTISGSYVTGVAGSVSRPLTYPLASGPLTQTAEAEQTITPDQTAAVSGGATATYPAEYAALYGAAPPVIGSPSSYLLIPPATAWSGDNGATVTQLNPWQWTRQGPPVTTPWFIPISAYFQRWPPSWDPGTYRGMTQSTIADVWAYVNKQLKSGLREEMLQDGPYAYWPLTDAEGSSAASNIAPGNTNPLNVVQSKYGAAGVTQAFGQNSGALPGDTTTTITTSSRSSDSTGMWGQSGVTASTQGYTLQCSDPGYPSIANGVTITGWFGSSSATFPANGILFSVADTTGIGTILAPYIDSSTGDLVLSWNSSTGIGGETIVAADFQNAPGPYHLAITFSRTSYTCYYNGGATVVSGTFGGGSLPAQFTVFSANGRASTTGETGNFYSGYSAHYAIYPYEAQFLRITTWYYMGAFAFGATQDGESDDKRINRLLGYAGVPAPRCVLDGNLDGFSPDTTQVVSVQDIGGQPAATSLTNLAASTIPSQLYVAPNGDIVYRQKTYTYNQPVMWVLGDDVAAGEIPMETDYAPDYDPARVVNDITITQLDDQSVTVPDIPQTEQLSIAQYGDQTYQVTGYVQNDLLSAPPIPAGIPDLANWIAEAGAKPSLRVAQVTVNAASKPYAWPFVLQASSGDMITVNIRPPTSGGQLVSITGRINQTQRTFTFGAQTTAALQCLIDIAPEAQALTCDSATLGLLNGTDIFGW